LRWITRGDAGPGQADLVARFSMPHIKPQAASLRKFLAGGTSCTKVVPRGTRLALHATPDAESLFIGWRHAGSAASDVLQEPVEIRCAREQCGQLANVTNEFGMIACHRDSVES